MASKTAYKPRTLSVADQHRAWLELVDTEGPFLAIPPLKRVWPQGMPALSSVRKAALVDARKAFETAWERYDRAHGSESALDAYRAERDKWVETVLRDVAGWSESLSWGEVAGIEAYSPNRFVAVRAQASLQSNDGIGALVHVIDPVDSLRDVPGDLWAANPIDRAEVLLRENRIPIGIVTDGRWWGLVCARDNAMAASGIIDALTWIEEPRARDAFLALIGRQYIIGGDESERLPVLFEESVAAAEEITEALGAQVRRAVELLVQSFSESAADARRRSLPDPLPARPHDAYEAAVTVMMRVVFLLFAEERGLLPQGELFDQGYGIARELDQLITRESEESEEALDATSLAWHRLLATSNALYRGASFENLRMPAYGGSLFDPLRFPFLTSTNELGTLGVTVSDRVMLHVLRSVQIADIKGEARRISFRDVDVEQIGYMYEGLLGYTAVVAPGVIVGITGARGEEPEIPLAKLEELAAATSDRRQLAKEIRAFIETDQPSAKPSSEAAIAKAIDAAVDPIIVSSLTQAVGDDPALRERVRPWLGLVRRDLRNRPFVVLDGALLVRETPSRKNAGAHYTPKSLAEDVVKYALEPLCYLPGPHQTANRDEWKPKSPADILNLKVADIACGSGAFLVAAGRFLADRLVEAWVSENPAFAGRKDLRTLAIREVVAKCLYGADINDMAIEMCKLSLWLVSLDRDLPFSFVDDKVFLGNSLLGLTDLRQLRAMHIDPAKANPQQGTLDIFDVDVDSIIKRAVELRESLASPVESDDSPARSAAAKHRQLAQLHEVTADLRKLADGVVATGLALGGRPGRALDAAYEGLRDASREAYPSPRGGEADSTWLDAKIDQGLTPAVETDYLRWRPLHWIIEAADVLVDHGGFDAIVGNPPFLAGKKIAIANGPNMEGWTKVDLGGVRGSADLCAHFIRRAWTLVRGRKGSIGLIANDRVGQGDTSAMSTQILATEGTIYRAVSQFRWPGAASTSASIVWATHLKGSRIETVLDGEPVETISPALANGDEADLSGAKPLPAEFLAGMGVSMYGEGFVLQTHDPMLESLGPVERSHLRRFVNGESLLSGRDSGRLAVDVNRYSTEAALFQAVPTLGEHLRKTVKPVRDEVTSQVHDSRYWGHWDKRDALFASLSGLEWFVVTAQTTRLPVFLRQTDPSPLFTDKVIVFATDSFAHLGALSSAAHFAWFEETRTPRGATSSYTVSRVLRPFPFPSVSAAVERTAENFDSLRAAALAKYVSVTKLYNAFDDRAETDPLVVALRDAQDRLDVEVCRAYGWEDLDLDHGFFDFSAGKHYTVSPEVRAKMRRRLLDLNKARSSSNTSSQAGRANASATTPQMPLFGEV
ncbi:DNA methyltransferase [Rathayibacter sp. AY1D5]|uniref:DNA methyltransferase n=1 Tax=Rathayibacter sp. AY1D5 TaxID=2080546 RepID=UPI0011B02C41|nr:DNA methyltransferase [Rathayibacter sp. AY1D5]